MADEALRRFAEANCAELAQSDLARAVEKSLGIDVAVDDLGDGIDGLAWSRGSFRLVLVNSRTAWTRQLFTIAHEVGHIIPGDAQELRLDLDVMSPTGRRQASEMRANASSSR